MIFSTFRFSFLDGEFGWYESNGCVAVDASESPRVLVLGDSVSKCSWQPSLLSPDTYNYALGGGSVFEEYYYLEQYLDHHEAPEYLIYTSIPSHLTSASTIWTRSIYFHRLDAGQFARMFRTLAGYGAVETILAKTPDVALWDEFCYLTFSPLKYRDAFLRGLESDERLQLNEERFEQVRGDRGWCLFGRSPDTPEPNKGVAGPKEFSPSACARHYLEAIVELCEQHDITFIFQSPWVNEATRAGIEPSFESAWEEYFSTLKAEHPSVIINAAFEGHPNDCFGDVAHLNAHGSVEFCAAMRERYPYVFRLGEGR